LSLDSASTAVFSISGIWLAVVRNWNFAVMNARQYRRCMTSLSLLEFWLRIATTAALSHRIYMVQGLISMTNVHQHTAGERDQFLKL